MMRERIQEASGQARQSVDFPKSPLLSPYIQCLRIAAGTGQCAFQLYVSLTYHQVFRGATLHLLWLQGESPRAPARPVVYPYSTTMGMGTERN